MIKMATLQHLTCFSLLSSILWAYKRTYLYLVPPPIEVHTDMPGSGDRERSAAAASFTDCQFGAPGDGAEMYPLGNRVSRKKDFIPPLTATFTSDDWSLPAENKVELPETDLVMHENSNGFLFRQSSNISA